MIKEQELRVVVLIICCMLIAGCAKPIAKSPKVIPQIIVQEHIIQENTMQNPPQAHSARQKILALVQNDTSNPIDGEAWEFISIMSLAGGVITLRELVLGSEIWTLSPLYYAQFGDAYNWKMQILSDGHIRFINKMTQTCLNANAKTLSHQPCENQNLAQIFKLTPMKNGTLQIQNLATQKCLEISFTPSKDYRIKLGKCLRFKNLEQQWMLIPPFVESRLIAYP